MKIQMPISEQLCSSPERRMCHMYLNN